MMNFKSKIFIIFSFSLIFLNNNFLHAVRNVKTQDLVNAYYAAGFDECQVETIINNLDKVVRVRTNNSKRLSISEIVKICRISLPGISDQDMGILIKIFPNIVPKEYLISDKKHQYRNKLIPVNKALQIVYDIVLVYLEDLDKFYGLVPEYSGLKSESKMVRRSKIPTLFSENNEYEEIVVGPKKIVQPVEYPSIAVISPEEFLRQNVFWFAETEDLVGYQSAPERLEGRNPEWSPDGKFLAVLGNRGNTVVIPYFPANLDDGYDPDEDEEDFDDADVEDLTYMLKKFRA